MNPLGFDDYLALVGRLLGTGADRRGAIARELSDHLQERLADLTAQGVPQAEAIHQALAEFGDAVTLAARFSQLARDTRRRSIMRWTVGSLACAVIVVALGAILWPDPRHLNRAVAEDGKPVETAEKAAAQPAPSRLPSAGRTDEQRDAEVRAKLAARISAEFVETPLDDVIDYFRDATKTQIHVKWNKLEELGVSRGDTHVTLRLVDTPADMILDLLLEPYGADYMVDRGLLVISSAENLRGKLSVQVCNVQDLLPEPSAKPTAAAEPPEAGPSPAMQQLMELIRTHIAPSSWVDNGGHGAITAFEDLLVVTQTEKTVGEVERFLMSLREAHKTKAGSSKLVR